MDQPDARLLAYSGLFRPKQYNDRIYNEYRTSYYVPKIHSFVGVSNKTWKTETWAMLTIFLMGVKTILYLFFRQTNVLGSLQVPCGHNFFPFIMIFL